MLSAFLIIMFKEDTEISTTKKTILLLKRYCTTDFQAIFRFTLCCDKIQQLSEFSVLSINPVIQRVRQSFQTAIGTQWNSIKLNN